MSMWKKYIVQVSKLATDSLKLKRWTFLSMGSVDLKWKRGITRFKIIDMPMKLAETVLKFRQTWGANLSRLRMRSLQRGNIHQEKLEKLTDLVAKISPKRERALWWGFIKYSGIFISHATRTITGLWILFMVRFHLSWQYAKNWLMYRQIYWQRLRLKSLHMFKIGLQSNWWCLNNPYRYLRVWCIRIFNQGW